MARVTGIVHEMNVAIHKANGIKILKDYESIRINVG